MALKVQRFVVTLSGIGEGFAMKVPINTEVALRVHDKYDPSQPPPNPMVVIVAVFDSDDAPALITREFTMVVEGDPLPANYLKYIGSVPFGPDKIQVDIIEVAPSIIPSPPEPVEPPVPAPAPMPPPPAPNDPGKTS